MKVGKAPGPSGIVLEMIQAAGDIGASMIHDLAATIVRDFWLGAEFHCLPLQGKRGRIGKGQIPRSQAQEQVMIILERIVDGLIRQLVSIDDSQFGFIPGRDTTDTIFVVRQLQEKYLAANKRLYMAFVDLEKAPRKVIWWALRKLGVEEWFVRLVQGMYANAPSCVCVGEEYSEEFEWRLVFIKDQYSARCSSSLCLKPYHMSSALGSPGRTSMTLLSSLNRLRNVSGGS